MPEINQHDRIILRDLAMEVRAIADLPVMAERRDLWKRHNSLQRVRPLVLVFPEGAWRELLPDSVLACEAQDARGMERELRRRIYQHRHIRDDAVIGREWKVFKPIASTGWGLEPRWRPSDAPTGAMGFDPVLLTPADLRKLKCPEIGCDEKGARARLRICRDLFGDILEVGLVGIRHISFHLMRQYVELRGLEQAMLDMAAEPQLVHDAMAFFEQSHQRILKQYQDQNLLELNNDGAYHSSGGVGFTDELPKPGYDPAHVRPADMWSSAESQELAQVSPEMHAEFALEYEKRLLRHFGLNGYGCCEDLTRKIGLALTIPNIRRISISPWADVAACAAQLGNRCIFSWKPHPAHLVGDFQPKAVRAYLRQAIRTAKGCVLEIILKDTHTCENRPERFTQWSQIAMEEAARKD